MTPVMSELGDDLKDPLFAIIYNVAVPVSTLYFRGLL
jgi:hypothetical protein